jgi:DNA-binding transcriptional MerR regulator
LTLEPVPPLILFVDVATEGQRRRLQSGELAKLTGVSTDTLRHYERLRVLPIPMRTAAGYRQYPPEAVDRVLLVRRAIGLGFTLAELARILQVRDRGGAPCGQVHTLAVEKLAKVEQQITDLTVLRDELQLLVAQWGKQLRGTPEGQRAGLLEALIRPPSKKEQSE